MITKWKRLKFHFILNGKRNTKFSTGNLFAKQGKNVKCHITNPFGDEENSWYSYGRGKKTSLSHPHLKWLSPWPIHNWSMPFLWPQNDVKDHRLRKAHAHTSPVLTPVVQVWAAAHSGACRFGRSCFGGHLLKKFNWEFLLWKLWSLRQHHHNHKWCDTKSRPNHRKA